MKQTLSTLSSDTLALAAALFLVAAVILAAFEIVREKWPAGGIVCGLNAFLLFVWACWIHGISGDAIRIDIIVVGLPVLGLSAASILLIVFRLTQFVVSKSLSSSENEHNLRRHGRDGDSSQDT